jgi:hypothetical protein
VTNRDVSDPHSDHVRHRSISDPHVVGIDPTVPSVARVADYFLGGWHNFAADREAAGQVLKVFPGFTWGLRQSRLIMARMIRFLHGEGIDQFLDLGSGIPTQGSSHEVAQALDPSARVVYVDHDRTAILHSREILEHNRNAAAVQRDLTDVASVLDDPLTRRTLDLNRPVGLLMFLVLHFFPDPQAGQIVNAYLDRLPAGSYLAMVQASPHPDLAAGFDTYSEHVAHLYLRDQQEVSAMLAGLEIVEPGVVYGTLWRPDEHDVPEVYEPGTPRSYGMAACARRPLPTKP